MTTMPDDPPTEEHRWREGRFTVLQVCHAGHKGYRGRPWKRPSPQANPPAWVLSEHAIADTSS